MLTRRVCLAVLTAVVIEAAEVTFVLADMQILRVQRSYLSDWLAHSRCQQPKLARWWSSEGIAASI